MTDRPHCSWGLQHNKQLCNAPSALVRVFTPAAGYGVTTSSTLCPVVVEQCPFEPPQVMPHYHGRHQLNRYDDGLEKYTGCKLYAWTCPVDVIYVETVSNEPGTQYSPGEHYERVYQINHPRCTFRSICIEACLTRTLTMSTDLDELTGPGHEDLIYEKEDLLTLVPEGTVSTPHPMVEGTEDSDYYREKVVGSIQAQIDWVWSHRFEDLNLESARTKAAPTVSDRSSRHTMRGALR